MWGDFMTSVARRYPEEPWSNADLLFLASALGRGVSLAESAGFLRRTEEQVRKQSELMSSARDCQKRSPIAALKAG
jgi:hypothetical protein